MSELPDDLHRWPHDPFALLGLDRQAGFRDLRRAYARLIRQYKPEHHPEQFRRIREAYEALEPLLRAQESADEQPAPVVPADPPPPAPQSVPEAAALRPEDAAQPADGETAEKAADESADEPAAEPEADPLDAYWLLTGTEQAAEGYEQLRQHLAADPLCEGAYLRLYWMLVVQPELDPLRHRCDWLVEGLQRGAAAEWLESLYLEELRRDEQEAITPRCEDFLAARPRDLTLLPVVEARWLAAGREQCWSLILRDLDRLRPAVEADEPRDWIRLVLKALDHLAWSSEASVVRAVQEYRSEIDGHPDAHFALDAEFSRYDLLGELVEGCRNLRGMADIPQGLAALLQKSWNEPRERTRSELLALLRELDAAGSRALAQLDQVQATCPAAMHQFGLLVDDLYREFNVIRLPRRRPDLEKEVGECIRLLPPLTYHALRAAIARFCTQEMITLETFLQVTADLAQEERVSADEILTRAATDAALHYYCKAMVAFWT